LPAVVAELLSDVEIRNAKPQDKPRKLCDVCEYSLPSRIRDYTHEVIDAADAYAVQ